MEGFGEKSVDNILKSIKESCNTNFESIISGAGIPLIGKTVAKDLSKKFNGYSDIITYLFYSPELDTALEPKSNISFTELDKLAQMRDKMRNDFVKMNIDYDKDTIWS